MRLDLQKIYFARISREAPSNVECLVALRDVLRSPPPLASQEKKDIFQALSQAFSADGASFLPPCAIASSSEYGRSDFEVGQNLIGTHRDSDVWWFSATMAGQQWIFGFVYDYEP